VAGLSRRPGGHHTAPAMIAGHEVTAAIPDAPADPRAVRVTIAATTRLDGDAGHTVAPPADPADCLPGKVSPIGGRPSLDGTPVEACLDQLGGHRADLRWEGNRTRVLFGPIRRDAVRGAEVREVVVGGWRFEIEIEPERRAVLRERARRSAGTTGKGGPVEVRAIIPGRVVAVSVAMGDTVEAGQQVLVVEAMKMQNELRAPREGTIERVGVAVGDTIEVGDLLVVIH
jgi:biotin carboxyl carrier protein